MTSLYPLKSFDINISFSCPLTAKLVKQMINPQHNCEYCKIRKWEYWSFEERKLFRENIIPFIHFWKTMRNFGESVRG